MKKLSLLLLIACSAFFAACDDNESSAADITAISFDSEYVISQPDLSAGNELTLYVKEGSEENLKEVVVTIAVSDNATVDPASGSKVDLSKGSVEFTVTAENGTKKIYVVKVSTSRLKSLYDFEEEWVEEKVLTKKFLIPGPKGIWASSNFGADMATKKLAVTKETEIVFNGKNTVKIETHEVDPEAAESLGESAPKVTAGTLFTGTFKFDLLSSLTKPLAMTKFGIPYEKKPLIFSGYFKYKAGDKFYRVPEEGTKDKPVLDDKSTDNCTLNAFLYDITDNSEFITGENTYEDERIIAIAKFSSGDVSEYTRFEKQFEYKKEYDPSKKYRLAIIMSSSAEGDKFNGAPGSVLYVDDIEIISE